MGMYTELQFRARIKKDAEIIDILDYMFGQNDIKPEVLPEHELFECDRWESLGSGNSAYFDGESFSYFTKDDWRIVLDFRCNLKNYDSEIQKFLDWIEPYLDEYNQFLGHYIYEERNNPTFIYIDEDKTLVTVTESILEDY